MSLMRSEAKPVRVFMGFRFSEHRHASIEDLAVVVVVVGVAWLRTGENMVGGELLLCC